MSRNRLAAYAFGAVFLLVGIWGFLLVTDFVETNTEQKILGIFEVNGLHNVVHLLVGAALLWAAWAGFRAARSMNLAVGGVYALVGIIGLFMTGADNDANILSVNLADNLLHIATAAVLLGVALTETADVEVAESREARGGRFHRPHTA